ncbi:MAG: dihydrodipicolinate synthase family protein [Planctomycetes bacterium]|nr:dihydrodipicolinate synthase family protein [Planctomycetota bacterium]
MYLPQGAFAPVPTPLDAQDRFAPTALAAHLSWLKAEGLDGALILGTNGEFASFSLAERLEVARAAAQHSAGLKLLLNVGGCALPEVLELARAAAACGYGAVLLPPPWFYRAAPAAGLVAYFRRVLDASALPVLLYHFPQQMGIGFTDELLDAIGPHPWLAGVKDSTGDEAELKRLSARFAQGSYLVGNDKLVAAALQAGGKGSISACASVVPDLVKSIRRKPEQQAKLNSVRGLLEKFGLMPAVKAILRRKGFGDYATRPPLVGLAEDQSRQLIGMLDMFGVIKW